MATYNLQFHRLAFQLDSPNLKVDSNGADVALGVGVVCETQKQAGLEMKLGGPVSGGRCYCSQR